MKKKPPASVTPQVEMEVLKLKPTSAPKIQKARYGKPFTPRNHPGQKRNDLPAHQRLVKIQIIWNRVRIIKV